MSNTKTYKWPSANHHKEVRLILPRTVYDVLAEQAKRDGFASVAAMLAIMAELAVEKAWIAAEEAALAAQQSPANISPPVEESALSPVKI